MKHLVFCRLLALGVASVLFLAGCRSATPPPEETPAQAPVKAQAAQKVVLGEWTDLLGTTQPLPNHSARVSAVVEGHVLSVLGDGKSSAVVEGQQVKAGQVIVQLDDRVPRANRDKLQATLTDLDEQHHQAGFAIELVMIDVNRLKELHQSSQSGGQLPLVSRVELAKADVQLKDAQSKLKSVEARQAVARAELKALDEQLRFYTLRAPIAGRLSMIQVVPGQTLSPGAVVAEILNLDQIDVLCFAAPRAAARLALEQTAALIAQETREGEPPFPQGKVAFIGVQAQPETGNVGVKARFPNPDFRLRANAVVRVNVLTKPEKERLTIPEAALMEDRDVPIVVAVHDVKTEKKDGEEHKIGKARKLEAVLGVRDRERGLVEILALHDPATKDKVAPDDLLFVTAGAHGLQNDDLVKIEALQSDKH